MKIYYKICKQCGNIVYIDDIDYMFDGCQNEHLICYKCKESIFVRVRYGKISRVERTKLED